MTNPLHTHTVTPSMSWQGPQGECPWCRAAAAASEGPTMTDTVNSADALLPCPFCGGEAKHSPKGWGYAETVSCGCGVDFDGSPEEWNTRAQNATPAPQVEAQPVAGAPERIWAWYDTDEEGWDNAYASTDKADRWAVEYIRADLAHPSPAPEAGDLISRDAAIKAIADMDNSVIHAIDAVDALRALTAPVSPQCCMCGKTGLSTADDGGPECELSDGRWVCSSDCWETASLIVGAAPVSAVDVSETAEAVAARIIAAWNSADHRSFPDAADGRHMPPMGDELMTAGLNGEDARFVAIQLAQNGLTLVPAPAPPSDAKGV